MDFQQQLQDLQKSHNRFMWLLVIVMLFIVIGFVLFSHNSYNQQIKDLQDTMKVHDKQAREAYQRIQVRITIDSLRYSGIQQQVNNVPNLIQDIKQKYDKQRNAISHLSSDEQFSYFTDWLSKADSL